MAEIKTRVCDFGRPENREGRFGPTMCRTLSDNNCEMCSGDFCDDHLKLQAIELAAQFIKRIPADNNNTPRAHTNMLEATEIKLCPRCHELLARSYENRFGSSPNDAHIDTIDAAILEARATIVDAIKAFWALKALEKGTP